MLTKSMLFSALFTVATMAQAAVPGEIIAVVNLEQNPYGWAVVSPDGGNLTYLPCVGDPTHGGVPRFFLSHSAYRNVLHVDNQNRPDRWSNELLAADEDCAQSLVLSHEGNKLISGKRWSPDGYMVAVSAEEYDPATNTLVHSGVYVADVNYTGNRPTSISSLRQIIETGGSTGLDWSPDGGKIVYTNTGGDLVVYTLGTGTSVNITNTPGYSEEGPTWSSRGRIAYQRVSEVSRSGNRIDVFSVPETGGAELRITSKSTTGNPRNTQACYSPDGQYISFISGSQYSMQALNGNQALYKIRADGTGKAVKIIGATGQSWSFNHWRR
jgi:Tol biopolymer transport system component